MKKAIFLDRDGTIIVDKIYLNDPEQIVYLPRVEEALKLLSDHGFLLIGATNQSGVPRGLVQIENLHEIHRRIQLHLASHKIEMLQFYYAPFMTDTDHPMRKPNPGMLEQGAREYGVDLKLSWMVGDRMTDVEAGHRAGCRSVLLGSLEDPKQSSFLGPEIWADDLFSAAQEIIRLS